MTDEKDVRLQPVAGAMADPVEAAEIVEQKNTHPETKTKPQPSLKNYWRVFSYGTKLDAFLMGLSFITSIGAGIALPLMNIVFGKLVGNFAGYFMENSTVTRQQFQATVNKNALYLVYIFIGKFVLSYTSMISVRISGLRISAAFRLAYLRATFAQPVSVIDTVSPGKVSTRITTSSNTVQLGISQHFSMTFQALAMVVGLYVVAFIKNWLLTLISSAGLPVILIIFGIVVPPFMKIHKVTEEYQEEASALSFEIFSSIRVVVAFGAEARLARQHEALLEKAAQNSKKEAPLMGLMMSPSMSIMYGMLGLAFWFGIRQYSRGKIADISDIIIVLFSVMTAVMNIGRLVSPIIAIAKAATAATELFATIDAVVPDTSGVKDLSANADISFDNVAFSYPSRPNVPILQGFSATFEAGKVTAIVGPSGAGKSTVVQLVQRWYDLLGTTAREPSAEGTEALTGAEMAVKDKKSKEDKTTKKSDEAGGDEEVDMGPNTCTGALRIGLTNLRDVDSKWWRTNIGLVQQEPFLFNDTIFNNVTYGLCGTRWFDLPKEEKMVMVKEACKEACAEEFIDRLPQGYDTFVGESGIKLSGGQRQRIAIARAIIKNPSILILDEATSAIDVRTERIVQEALERVSAGRTTIVIAHRLSTIRKADKILVMRKGKLVEEGSHEELLMNKDGIYYGLVNAQKLTMEAVGNDLEVADLERAKTAEKTHSEIHETEFSASREDEKYKDRGFFQSGGRLLYEQQRKHWFLYTLSVLGVLCAGATYPVQALVFAKVIQVFTLTRSQIISRGSFWSGMFGVIGGACFLAYFTLGFCAHKVSIAITRYYRQEYLDNIIQKRIAYFDMEGNSTGSLTSRVSADTEQLQQLMSTEMSLAAISIVNIVGSTIIAFVYGWKLTLVAVFCAFPFIVAAGFMRLRLELQFEKMNAAVFVESSQFATEAVGAFRTVLSLIMEDVVGDRYGTLLNQHVKKAFGTARFGTLVFAASDSVEMACMALAFWYGGRLLASREYDIVDFFVIYMAVVYGAVACGQFMSMAPNISQATAAANRVLSMRPLHGPPPKYAPIQNTTDSASIEFRNVNFAYKSRSVLVLSNLNINIAPGQFAALVGASGCGKSTTISLLERFYDAVSGAVLYNGQDITTLDPDLYRKNISLVSQEPTLYQGTIRDNVALSVDNPDILDAEIHQACSDAQIHDFITSLPDGYNTRLGPKGMSLSGGQKQRLSLARALLRKPKLLLLDEATSSLDSESEKLVQEAIEKAAGKGGRTILAVAHRLATIQKADVIFVLGSGSVLEKGDHQSLLRKRGVYWQMCQAQALDR